LRYCNAYIVPFQNGVLMRALLACVMYVLC